MVFSSLVFLFVFLPCILLLYHISPRPIKNYILILFSLIFYAWGGVSYVAIIVGSILFNFIFARLVKKHKPSKTWLRVGITFNILLLATFKYLEFFISNFNEILFSTGFKNVQITEPNIVLPIGISFFTFQQMSMLWDIYRTDENRKITFMNTALYVGFFPQLIAGPIVRYNDIIDQIKSRKESLLKFESGIKRFVLGLFKKVVIANTCAELAKVTMIDNFDLLSPGAAWIGIIAYCFQIYFDFSGYSDMAIGLGRMFGFEILENFNFPYTAKSIKDFWRRWHISLSSWFRDYVYIPLGGNKKGNSRTYFNLSLVFLLTGFWHGAEWSFIFWGAFHGLFLVIEKLGLDRILTKLPKAVQWLYMILVVMIGWVFFKLESVSVGFEYLSKMFFIETNGVKGISSFLNPKYTLVLIIAFLASTTLLQKGHQVITNQKSDWKPIALFAGNIVVLALLLTSVMFLNSSSFNPFIYFRF